MAEPPMKKMKLEDPDSSEEEKEEEEEIPYIPTPKDAETLEEFTQLCPDGEDTKLEDLENEDIVKLGRLCWRRALQLYTDHQKLPEDWGNERFAPGEPMREENKEEYGEQYGKMMEVMQMCTEILESRDFDFE